MYTGPSTVPSRSWRLSKSNFKEYSRVLFTHNGVMQFKKCLLESMNKKLTPPFSLKTKGREVVIKLTTINFKNF